MTQIPGSEGGTQPLRPDQVLQKAAQPQRQAASPETEPATKRLAEQSHTLELSKSRMPASELAALKVHFSEQKSAKGSPETFAQPDGWGTAWPEATHPIYGSPAPKLPKGLLKDWPKDMDMRLIYGAPSPSKPREGKPEKNEKPPHEAEPIQPRLIYGSPTPSRPERNRDWLQDLVPLWPDDMGMRLIYGAPSPLLKKLEF